MSIEERLNKHLTVTSNIHDSVYIAEGAIVIGDVTIAKDASVWHNCVLRGDINSIEIDEGTNVQDGTVIHLADDYGVKVGKYVTIGHSALIHACEVEDECLIGMHSTIMDGAKIGKRSIVGAGAVVTQHKQIPPGSLVLGNPAKVVRQLTEEEQNKIREWAEKYVIVSAYHSKNR